MNQAFSLSTAERVHLPGFEIDLARHELRTTGGAQVELRPRSFAVLHLLASHLGRLVPKDEIMSKVWNDATVTDDSLTQCIVDIRRALGDDARRIVRTVPRRGYVLIGGTGAIPTEPETHGLIEELPQSSPPHEQVAALNNSRGYALSVLAAGGAVLALLCAAWWVWGPGHRPSELVSRMPDRPSLAVMAFRSVVPSERNDLLATGVATDIINELARNKDLRVLARESSFALSGQNLTPSEAGKRLRVRYLLEGTVQRRDEFLNIDVQLVDTRDGAVAWAEHFQANAEHIAYVQPAIAGKITRTMHSGLRETEKRAILQGPPRDMDVYELTLRGLALKHQFNPEATRTGRRDLEEALAKDPNYAPAWVNYAWLNLVDVLNQFTGTWDSSHIKVVLGQFNRAIELDPSLPNAYQGLSRAVSMTGATDEALRHIRRALELGPSDADNLLFYATALLQNDNVPEALIAVQQALDLNPIRPSYYARHYGEILWSSARLSEALEQSEDCLRKASKFTHCEIFRILSLVELGRLAEADKFLRDAIARSPPFEKAIVAITPRPPRLAARYRDSLQKIGWTPPS